MVEFAIVSPILALLTMGMIETTRGFMVKEALDDACRAAVRLGSVPGGSKATMTTCINDILTDHGLDATKATVEIKVNDATKDPNLAKQFDKISAKVSLPASAVGWTGAVFLAGKNVNSQTYSMLRLR